MKIFRLCALAAAVLITVSGENVHALNAKSTKKVLDNGLTVLITEMPENPMVSVYGLVKTGSATEGEMTGSGISHYLEHMLFKGTEERGVGEIAAEIKAVGGSINASTSFDYTIYVIDVPAEHFETGLDVLRDMLFHARMDPEEAAREKEVVLNELRLIWDNPARYHSKLIFATAYLNHPYRHPIIGYKDLILGITNDDLLWYYDTHYTPNNMVLSVAGNVKSKEILPKIEEAFGGYARLHAYQRNLPAEPEPILERFHEEAYPQQKTRLSMAFASVPLLHPDLFALDVMAVVLGQGRSSRLYKKMIDEDRMIDSVSVSNYTPVDRGLFEVDMQLDYENVEEAKKEVWRQIEMVKDKGISRQELEKAQRQTRSQHIMNQDRTSSVAHSQALNEAFTGDHLFDSAYLEGIENVTTDDLLRVARQYLVRSRLSTVVLRPLDAGEDAGDEDDPEIAGDIQKVLLENGLTVLLRRDATLPVVDYALKLQGGVRQNPEDLPGLSNFVGSLWSRATKKYPAEKLAELTESHGMRLGGFAGKNSFGFSLKTLVEDKDLALDIFTDILKNPVFPVDQLELKKKVSKTTLLNRDDSIHAFTGHRLRQLLFKEHPYRMDETGTVESIDRITRDDLTEFYETLVVPENMVLSVFGDIDPEAMLEEIERRMGRIPPAAVNLKDHSEPLIEESRRQEYTLDKNQAMVMIGLHGPSMFSEDRYPVNVMTAVLGSSFNGRLFARIREDMGAAYTVTGYYVPGMEIGSIQFYALTTKKQAAEVEKVMREEIAKLRDHLVSEEELEDITTFLIGQHKSSLQTSGGLSFATSLDELYGLGYDHYRDFEERIRGVTPEQVQEMARKYLDLERSATVVTLPEKDSVPEEIETGASMPHNISR